MTDVCVCVCTCKAVMHFPGGLPHCGGFNRWPLEALPSLLQFIISDILPTRYRLLHVILVTQARALHLFACIAFFLCFCIVDYYNSNNHRKLEEV